MRKTVFIDKYVKNMLKLVKRGLRRLPCYISLIRRIAGVPDDEPIGGVVFRPFVVVVGTGAVQKDLIGRRCRLRDRGDGYGGKDGYRHYYFCHL
jgi:hypothetical protein